MPPEIDSQDGKALPAGFPAEFLMAGRAAARPVSYDETGSGLPIAQFGKVEVSRQPERGLLPDVEGGKQVHRRGGRGNRAS